MKTTHIAMLGSGFVADCFMQGLANVPGQEVVVNYSRSEGRARLLSNKWQIPESSTDLDSLIARRDIDLYIIALPNDLHLPVGVALAQAGKHQVCTKPLARNSQEARKLLEAVRAAGVMHGYAETEVFAPAVVKANQIIKSGAIGRVLWVRSREGHSGPHNDHFWSLEKTGGGAMIDLGCHCVEAARYFFGKDDRIDQVFAWGATLEHGDKTEGEDNALLLLRFASGGIAHCELSWTSRGGLDLRNEVHGSKGSIFTDVTRETPIKAFAMKSFGYVVEKADVEMGWTQPVPEEAFTYGYQAEMRHFIECLQHGKSPCETYEDGYIVNRILEAGYSAISAGCWVTVDY